MNEPPAIPEVSPAHTANLAKTGAVYLLDVREQQEWNTGHAPHAHHLPLGDLDPDAVPRDLPVVAACRSGNRANMAAQALAAAGHEVRIMTGGMEAWAAAGLPMQSADSSPGLTT